MSRVEAWGFEGTVSLVGPRAGDETELTRCSGRIGQRETEAQRDTLKEDRDGKRLHGGER